MTRRVRTEMARQAMIEAGLLAPDQSWQRFARCEVCNRRICVNNYPDRKVRATQLKVRGVLLCHTCRFGSSGTSRGDNGDFVSALYRLAEQMAAKGCTNVQTTPELDGEVHRACGRCAGCVAMKVMAKSPKAKAKARAEARRIKDLEKGRVDDQAAHGADGDD